jgi:hypothetical protein
VEGNSGEHDQQSSGIPEGTRHREEFSPPLTPGEGHVSMKSG